MMMRAAARRLAATLPLLALAVFLAPSPAVAGLEHGRGKILSIDWNSMQMMLQDPQGGTRAWKVAPDASVKFTDGTEFFMNPAVKDLAVGMYVHYVYESTTQVIESFDVREVPGELLKPRPTTKPATPEPPSSRVLKVRIIRIDERRAELRADVAGRQDTFRMNDPRALRRYAEGDMVILTLESRRGEELVTDIRPAAQKGEVRRIDGHRGEIAINVNGQVETYRVSDKRLLDGIRVGDRIRFEFEDRPGTDVITAIY